VQEDGSIATLVNGVASTVVSAADRGLQYGDGLFETITCVDGEPRWLGLHLQRLQRGCERLGLRFDALETLHHEICSLSQGRARCIVKVILTRGLATVRGYRPMGNEAPTRIVSCHDWPQAGPGLVRAPGVQTPGIRIGVSEVRLGENPLLAGLKHLNRLEQVLAQRALGDLGLDEALMCSSAGSVICAISANVFLVDDNGVFTPAVDLCGIAGVMRRLVLDTAAAAGRPITVRSVSVDELAYVKEMFLTNVRLGLQTVRWLNGRELRQDGEARRLRDLMYAT